MRSWLFTPGNDRRKVSKALTAAADVVIVDWEDGVPEEQRSVAHELALELLSQRAADGPRLVIRTQSAATPGFAADLEVIGLEIDPERVLPPRDGVRFELGGFELADHRPHLVRAFNVLRQYDVDQVERAWESVLSRLVPGGLFIEGTCDEIGRRAVWLLLDRDGPVSLTFAWDPWDVEKPSDLAERLPKILIHRNVPGERIHALLSAADQAWDHAAGWEPYGPRVRWRNARQMLIDEGWPITPVRRNLRDSLLTVPWAAVAPEGGATGD